MNANAPPPRQGIPLRPDRDARRKQSMDAVMRACAARSLAVLDKNCSATEHFRQRWSQDTLGAFIVRAATGPAMTTLPGWAAELSQSVVRDFLDGLGPASAGADLFGQALQLSVRGPQAGVIQAGASILPVPRMLPVHAGRESHLSTPHLVGGCSIHFSRTVVTSSSAAAQASWTHH